MKKPRKPKRVITPAEKRALTLSYNRGYIDATRYARQAIDNADERAAKAERQMETLDRQLVDRENKLHANLAQLRLLQEKNTNLIAAYMDGFTDAEYKKPVRFSTWELICGADKPEYMSIAG